MIAWKERMKDGRHVGLDFYDLLIEPIFVHNAYVVDASVASPGRDWAARWGPDTAGESLSDNPVYRPRWPCLAEDLLGFGSDSQPASRNMAFQTPARSMASCAEEPTGGAGRPS